MQNLPFLNKDLGVITEAHLNYINFGEYVSHTHSLITCRYTDSEYVRTIIEVVEDFMSQTMQTVIQCFISKFILP